MQENALPLRDLHLPDPVGWWPLAPGWWVIIALAALGLAWLAWRWYCAWQAEAPRRHALRELARIEAAYLEHRNPVELGKALSELLRRGMLAYAPRAEVAGLSGEAWLAWLDEGLSVPWFHTEGGKNLLSLPYRRPDDDLSDVDVGALISAVRVRLSTPTRSPA
jgi:hypothetical protein